MAKTEREEYKEQVVATKAALANKTKEWSEQEIKDHLEKVANIYASRKQANKLGNFDWDPGNVYYWNTYDGNSSKLANRLELGWGFATREDAEKAGLLDTELNDKTIDGETCIEMSHVDSKAVLLKIPREMYDMNQKVKERIKQNRPVLDSDGNLLDINKVEDNNSVVGKRTESMITIK